MKILFLLTLCASSFTSYNFNNDFKILDTPKTSINDPITEDSYILSGTQLNEDYKFLSYNTNNLNTENNILFIDSLSPYFNYISSSPSTFYDYTFFNLYVEVLLYNNVIGRIYAENVGEIGFEPYSDLEIGYYDSNDDIYYQSINLNVSNGEYVQFKYYFEFTKSVLFDTSLSINNYFTNFTYCENDFEIYQYNTREWSNLPKINRFNFYMTPYSFFDVNTPSFEYSVNYTLNNAFEIDGEITSPSSYSSFSYIEGDKFLLDDSSRKVSYSNDGDYYVCQFYNNGAGFWPTLLITGIPYYSFECIGNNLFTLLNDLFVFRLLPTDELRLSGEYYVNPQLYRRFYNRDGINVMNVDINFVSNNTQYSNLSLDGTLDSRQNVFVVYLNYGNFGADTRVYHVDFDLDTALLINEEYQTNLFSIKFENQPYTSTLMALLLIGYTPTSTNLPSHPGGDSNGNWLISTFDLIGFAFGSFISLFNVSIFPMITLGAFVLIPLTLGLILFIVNLFKR